MCQVPEAAKATLKARQRKVGVSFVGHVLSSQGVSTDPEKVAAAKLWPPPTNMSELCTFLGNIGYYRKFILDFVTLTGPLFHLEQKGNNFFVVQRLPRIIRHPKESTLWGSYPCVSKFWPALYLGHWCKQNRCSSCVISTKRWRRTTHSLPPKALSKSQKCSLTKTGMYEIVYGALTFYLYLISKAFTAHLDHWSLVWLQN